MPTIDLNNIAYVMNQMGMAFPEISPHSSQIDMVSWHTQATAISLKDSLNQSSSVTNVGKIWEQMASSLFIKNISTPLWGWQDPRSTWLLDFWLSFEPQIYFILLCVRPEFFLARLMENDESMPEVSDALQAWLQYHQKLLHFHLHNPEQSILIDAHECLLSPLALPKFCISHWGLPLNITSPFSDEVAAPGALTLWIGKKLYHDMAEVHSLQKKIDSSIKHIANINLSYIESAKSICSSFRKIRDRSVEQNALKSVQEALVNISEQKEILEKKIIDQDERQKQTSREIADIILEREELNNQISLLKAQIKEISSQQAFHEENCKKANQEKELLLLQLYQLQEELEDIFIKQQETQLQMRKGEERWKRMLQHNPNYYDYTSLEVKENEIRRGQVLWFLKDFDDGKRYFNQLKFQTVIEGDTVGLLFDYEDNIKHFLRWPLALINEKNPHKELLIKPIFHDTDSFEKEILNNLSTEDWNFIYILAQCILDFLKKTNFQENKLSFISQHLYNGFKKFFLQLRTLPSVPRYNRAILKNEDIKTKYAALWLRLEEFSWNGQSWPEFEFRLSCANPQEGFGMYPRLEFPKQNGQAPFNSWFVESENYRGPKLELRFAKPDAMDMDVWNRLSKNDQEFITALLERIPSILKIILHEGAQFVRPLDDWLTLCKDMYATLCLRTRPASPSSNHRITESNA